MGMNTPGQSARPLTGATESDIRPAPRIGVQGLSANMGNTGFAGRGLMQFGQTLRQATNFAASVLMQHWDRKDRVKLAETQLQAEKELNEYEMQLTQNPEYLAEPTKYQEKIQQDYKDIYTRYAQSLEKNTQREKFNIWAQDDNNRRTPGQFMQAVKIESNAVDAWREARQKEALNTAYAQGYNEEYLNQFVEDLKGTHTYLETEEQTELLVTSAKEEYAFQALMGEADRLYATAGSGVDLLPKDAEGKPIDLELARQQFKEQVATGANNPETPDHLRQAYTRLMQIEGIFEAKARAKEQAKYQGIKRIVTDNKNAFYRSILAGGEGPEGYFTNLQALKNSSDADHVAEALEIEQVGRQLQAARSLLDQGWSNDAVKAFFESRLISGDVTATEMEAAAQFTSYMQAAPERTHIKAQVLREYGENITPAEMVRKMMEKGAAPLSDEAMEPLAKSLKTAYTKAKKGEHDTALEVFTQVKNSLNAAFPGPENADIRAMAWNQLVEENKMDGMSLSTAMLLEKGDVALATFSLGSEEEQRQVIASRMSALKGRKISVEDVPNQQVIAAKSPKLALLLKNNPDSPAVNALASMVYKAYLADPMAGRDDEKAIKNAEKRIIPQELIDNNFLWDTQKHGAAPSKQTINQLFEKELERVENMLTVKQPGEGPLMERLVQGAVALSGTQGKRMFPLPEDAGWTITSKFGKRILNGKADNHGGIDYAAPLGVNIRATEDGVVKRAVANHPMNGNFVEIDHGNGYTTMYLHMGPLAIAPGTRVKAGQSIGKVGSTGKSTGPHLHLEVKHNGVSIDPESYLREAAGGSKAFGWSSTDPAQVAFLKRHGVGVHELTRETASMYWAAYAAENGVHTIKDATIKATMFKVLSEYGKETYQKVLNKVGAVNLTNPMATPEQRQEIESMLKEALTAAKVDKDLIKEAKAILNQKSPYELQEKMAYQRMIEKAKSGKPVNNPSGTGLVWRYEDGGAYRYLKDPGTGKIRVFTAEEISAFTVQHKKENTVTRPAAQGKAVSGATAKRPTIHPVLQKQRDIAGF